MMKRILYIAPVLFAPVVAFAQGLPSQDVSGVFTLIERFINALIPLLIGLATLYFIYGVFKFVKSAGDEGAREEGRSAMLYGIIGLAVMVSVWGLVGILTNTFGLDSAQPINPPDLPDINF